MKRGIGKTRCKPMRNLAKIQIRRSASAHPPPPRISYSHIHVEGALAQILQNLNFVHIIYGCSLRSTFPQGK